MNKEKLKDLIIKLRTQVNKKLWNMKGVGDPENGIPGCVLGHLPIFYPTRYTWDKWRIRPALKGYPNPIDLYDHIEHDFGLSRQEAIYLFENLVNDNYRGEETPEDVANRIEKFIESNGEMA